MFPRLVYNFGYTQLNSKTLLGYHYKANKR